MAPVDRSRRRRLLLAALAGILLGVAVGLFLPIRAAQAPDADAAAWSLPRADALKRFSDEDFRRLRSARFWGELARPGDRTQRPQASWKLHAIVTRPEVQVAVSQGGKADQAWVRLGGALPDGSTLVQVSRDGVIFEKDGCRRMRALYRASPTDPDVAVSGCPEVEDEAEAPAPRARGAPPPAAAPGRRGA